MLRRAALLVLALPAALFAQQPKPLAITGVTVIDVATGAAAPNRTVLVRGDRIAAVGKTGEVAVPADAETLDATGKFLIPGLWDMHVHIAGPDYLKLFLANGVTGVRDMHAFFPEATLRMRDLVHDGQMSGPRIVAAGALIDGPQAFWPGAIKATTPEEGRDAVRKLKEKGADFIKVYDSLRPAVYRAIAAESKAQGLPFVGHVPRSITLAEASDAGQHSVEHLTGLALACSARERQLRREAGAALAKADNSGAAFALVFRFQVQALDSYDEAKARALFAKLKQNQTYQTPTLTVLRALASLDDPKFTADPRLKYMPSYLTRGWSVENMPKERRPTKDDMTARRAFYEKSLKVVAALREAGVPILAGTDTTNPYCFPGFSLHDELELLVTKCGFTPLQALQTATTEPAKFFGREKELGAAESGKRADLLVLDADPRADIKNTTKIHAVIANGRLLRRAALDALLAEVAKDNGS
jgi:imidazolonepropionase-like amidohydrolase